VLFVQPLVSRDRYTDKENQDSYSLVLGGSRGRRVARRPAASPDSGDSRPPGAFRRSDLSRGNEQEKKSIWLLRADGVIRVTSASRSNARALSGSGARGVQGGRRQFPHQSKVAGPPVDGAGFQGRTRGHVLGCPDFVDVAPLWG